jgi:hypothetical protein
MVQATKLLPYLYIKSENILFKVPISLKLLRILDIIILVTLVFCNISSFGQNLLHYYSVTQVKECELLTPINFCLLFNVINLDSGSSA